jgi:hypothetical protein
MLDSLGGVIYYKIRLAQWILEKLNYYEGRGSDKNTKQKLLLNGMYMYEKCICMKGV